MKGFGSFHPAVLFTYYITVIAFSMVTMNPVLISSSLIGAFVLYGVEFGAVTLLGDLVSYACIFAIMTTVNPLFVHDGETPLFFMNGNAVTLEAIMYGAASSMMIVSILVWCRCYSKYMTTDKFLYLFGKVTPKLALILSMTFRFIPLFRKQAVSIGDTQRTMGLYSRGSIKDRGLGAFRTFDSLVGWSIEKSIDTADSMKARGYGLHGRTDYSIFMFRRRDGNMLAFILCVSALLAAIYMSGSIDFAFYPKLGNLETGAAAIAAYAAAAALMLVPALTEIKEQIIWYYLKSKA